MGQNPTRHQMPRRLALAAPVLIALLMGIAGLVPCAHAQETESMPLGGSPAGAALESLPIGRTGEGAADPFEFAQYLQTLLALGLVLGLAVGASVVFKKFARSRGGLVGAMGPGGPSPSGVLEILGRYPIGAGQTLVLLRFDQRVLLLHQVGGRKNPSMRTISEVADAEEVASIMMKTRDAASDAVDASFRETIRKMERGFAGTASAIETRAVTGVGPQGLATGTHGTPGIVDRTQEQIDLLVGDESEFKAGGVDVRAIRGRLRGWMGASS